MGLILTILEYQNVQLPNIAEYLEHVNFMRKEKDDKARVTDAAMKGGIDLNSANLAMMIKRDGKGVVLPLASQDLAQLSNAVGDGLEPRILSIVPASQSPVFAQLLGHP